MKKYNELFVSVRDFAQNFPTFFAQENVRNVTRPKIFEIKKLFLKKFVQSKQK